jgi:tetratricopeptide (TPR) repeat protein
VKEGLLSVADANPPAGYEYETVEVKDPVRRWLLIGIFVAVTAILALVVFSLVSGLFATQAPRTAIEARLVTLKDAAEGAPGSGSAQRDYIEALVVSGQHGAARDHIDLMKEQLDGFETTYIYLGELSLLYDLEDYEGVLETAQEGYDYEIEQQEAWVEEQTAAGRDVVTTILPQSNAISILVYQARASGAMGDTAAGVEYLTRALELEPTAADLLVLRGQGYAELGDTAAARADFEQALVFVPDFEPALEALGSLGSE